MAKNHTQKRQREVLYIEASLQALENSIQQKEKELEKVQARTLSILTEIQNSPSNVATPAQQVELKKLEAKEKKVASRLEQLKYQFAILEPSPGVPYHHVDHDEYDVYAVVDKYAEETAAYLKEIQAARDQANDRSNERTIDR